MGIIFGILVMATNTMAAPWIDVSSVSVDTDPVAALGLTVLTALAAMWVLRKLIKTTNRS